jgi:adenylate cyclase
LNYSVIGDTVNLSARLESLTRLYNVSNIVSEASRDAAPNFAYMELDEVCVAGKSQAIKIFQLLGLPNQISPEKLAVAVAFAGALKAYRAQNWSLAQRLFSQLAASCDNKTLPKVFLERIDDFKINPPSEDWNGVYIFGKK